MSFYIVWNKDHDHERPSTVNVPTARDVSFHSALVVPEDRSNRHLYDKAVVCNPGADEVQNIMCQMLLACLKARHSLPQLEYFHIAKMSGFLRAACDSKHAWFSALLLFKYRSQFEKRIPDLLLTISDFEDSEEPPGIKAVERANIHLQAYVGTLRTGELLKLMKTAAHNPRK
jgi:hypothetical protein